MRNEDAELVSLLRKVAALVRSGSSVHSDYFTDATEFADAIDDLAGLIKTARTSFARRIVAFVQRKKAKYTWAAPTCDLDDYLSSYPGAADLADTVYALL